MNPPIRIPLAAVAAALILASPAAAQSTDAHPLLGRWQLERETPRGPVSIPFEFVEEGDSIVVIAGRGENATSMGRVHHDGASVSFALDLRALMQQAMAGRGEGRRAGAAGAGRREAGRMEPPIFTGTLDGATLAGTLATPRGAQEFVLRRPEGG